MEGNNMSGKIAHLRDVFLECESEHIENLKKRPEVNELIKELNKRSGVELAKLAMQRIEMIENGKVDSSDLEKVESEIAVLLAAIENQQRERIKEKYKDDDDFQR